MQLNDIYIRDPFILFCDGVYYMYGNKHLEQRGFFVYKSNNLKEWSEPKQVFTPDEKFWGDRDFWAPEVHYYNNKYYMIASFKSETRKRASHILVSDTPDGDFIPLTDNPITPEEWECLDATLYIDRYSKPHIIFCYEWVQGGNGSVYEMPLSDDLTKAIGEPRVLWYASDCDCAVDALPNKKSIVTDGPFMYRLKNGELICIWSTFTKCGYSVLIARSDNGDIDGNWTIDSEKLLEVDGGHGMIFSSDCDKKMFVMHSPNTKDLERAKIYEVVENDNTIELKDSVY